LLAEINEAKFHSAVRHVMLDLTTAECAVLIGMTACLVNSIDLPTQSTRTGDVPNAYLEPEGVEADGSPVATGRIKVKRTHTVVEQLLSLLKETHTSPL